MNYVNASTAGHGRNDDDVTESVVAASDVLQVRRLPATANWLTRTSTRIPTLTCTYSCVYEHAQ